MARTQFEEANKTFTDKAHYAARRLIYPAFFGVPEENLEFETTDVADGGDHAVLDGQMAIDRRIHVETGRLHAPLTLTVQERFRRGGPPTHYENFQDLTITEWNCVSDLPSEMYKICSGLFAYAYYFEAEDRFLDAIIVSTPSLLTALCRDDVRYSRRENLKDQTFVAITFDALENAGTVLWRMPQLVPDS